MLFSWVMYFTPGIRTTSSWITHMLEESPNVSVVVTFQSYNVSFEAKKKKKIKSTLKKRKKVRTCY